jgi:hypothetical protein
VLGLLRRLGAVDYPAKLTRCAALKHFKGSSKKRRLLARGVPSDSCLAKSRSILKDFERRRRKLRAGQHPAHDHQNAAKRQKRPIEASRGGILDDVVQL